MAVTTHFFSHCHVHLSKKHSFLDFEGVLFYLLELFLTIQVRNNAVACLQAKPRPRRHARQSSTQTGTLRRWELEVWTRNSLTFSVELLHPESFPLTLWSRWVNILAHLSPYFCFFASKILFIMLFFIFYHLFFVLHFRV